MPIAIKRADGGVSIMYLVGDADAATELQKWQEGQPGQYVGHENLDLSAIPKDRTARADWSLNGKAIRTTRAQP